MTYKEPGVYLSILNSRPNTAVVADLTPLILGAGPAFMDHLSVPIVASVGGTDTLPSSITTAVLAVRLTLNGTIVDGSNYTYSSATNSITWAVGALTKPTTGATYYVDYEARPETTQYQATYITSFDDLDSIYGGQLMKIASGGAANTINPVYMGAYLALESGASGVYVVQIQPADTTGYNVLDSDWTNTLSNVVSFVTDCYQIIPMTQSTTAIASVIAHVNAMSTVNERLERVAFISKAMTATTTNGVVTPAMVTEFTGYVSTLLNKRVVVPFVPSKVTKTLSNGNIYEMTGEYVCAAMGGLDGSIPAERALTRQKLYNFIEIKDNKMPRSTKNQIAAVGAVVLEQTAVSTPITIRHGLTTLMDNVADREYSIVKCVDYTAKYLRAILTPYIGTNNIDDYFISKVRSTISSGFDYLVRNHKANKGDINTIAQDAVSPDTLLVTVTMTPPYPCNDIEITLVVD